MTVAFKFCKIKQVTFKVIWVHYHKLQLQTSLNVYRQKEDEEKLYIIISHFYFFQLEEHMAELGKDPENKKIKDLFKEAAASLELINIDEMHTLAETMFADMPDSEKGKEQDRLGEVDGKRNKALALIQDGRGKYGIGKWNVEILHDFNDMIQQQKTIFIIWLIITLYIRIYLQYYVTTIIIYY